MARPRRSRQRAGVRYAPSVLGRGMHSGPIRITSPAMRGDDMTMTEGHRAILPPLGVAIWDVDPYDPSNLLEPTAYYAELRRRGPLVYIPRYAILACGRYDVTKEIFSDHTRFVSSRGVGLTDFALEKPWRAPS